MQLYVTATDMETEEAPADQDELIRWLGANDLFWILDKNEDDERDHFINP